MKTVCIVCPWWRRPDITRLHCQSMSKFMRPGDGYLAILSPEDPDVNKLKELCNEFKLSYILHQNRPLSGKLNRGIREVQGYDYIMNMGSDDLCDPEYWNVIELFMGKPVFRPNALYIAEDSTFKRVWEINKVTMGVLRLIRTNIITQDLYTTGNSGLDCRSRIILAKLGYNEEIVPYKGVFAMDVKNPYSINKISAFARKEEKLVEVDMSRFL